jgi:signal recognition particle subunit SRP54
MVCAEHPRLERKIRKDSFTLEDFRDQIQQVRKMGSLESILGMIPGLPKKMKGIGGLDSTRRNW